MTQQLSPLRRRLRQLRNTVLALAGAFVVFTVAVVASGWTAFGKAASGARAERMHNSPQWGGEVFVNPQPLWNDIGGSMTSMMSPPTTTTPTDPVDVQVGDGALFATPPSSGLRVTWLGHSTSLIEIDGKKILTDPIFGGRASPFTWVGPDRFYPPPIPLDRIPAVDAVLISHDHHDHLQHETIALIKDWPTTFIAPIGVGAHLEYWGVPKERIVELDWWEDASLGDVVLHCTPARHASGRQVLDQNATLWAGYAITGPAHRIFYSGDTGLFPALATIGEKWGPFDLTMIETGAYNAAWPDWHIGPEQAVKAHQMLRGKVLLPVHWGLWSLASHSWTEPAERVLVAAAAADVVVTIPRPGQSIEPSSLPAPEKWWPQVPWRTAQEDPIVSTVNGDPAVRMK